MAKFKLGDRVETLIPDEPYYSGYGGNPRIVIPAGTVGVIGAVDVPAVRHRKGKPYTFFCVDFEIEGKHWRGSYYKDEIKLVKQ